MMYHKYHIEVDRNNQDVFEQDVEFSGAEYSNIVEEDVDYFTYEIYVPLVQASRFITSLQQMRTISCVCFGVVS